MHRVLVIGICGAGKTCPSSISTRSTGSRAGQAPRDRDAQAFLEQQP
jgi:hypothetical protein